MKRILLGGLVTASFFLVVPFSRMANAADLALKAPLAPLYSWTGFYVGGNVGYSWGNSSSNYNDPNFASVTTPPPTSISGLQKLDGIIGGGQVGYNWQLNRTWVAGLEADIQGSAERGSSGFSDPYSVGVACDIFCGTVSGTTRSAIDWFGTLRGRVGVLVNPTLLLYGTGGLAYGGVRTSGTITDSFPGGPISWTFGDSTTRAGWTAGAGIEGAIPNTVNWTWKLEYLYVDLGTISGSGFETAADFGPLPYTWSTRVTDNILRVGVNYRFDWAAPLVASY